MAQHEYLSKRFQQIMDIAYRQGQVTAADLEKELSGSPNNSTVRTQLRILEERGHLSRTEENGRYIYRPAREKPNAAKATMQRFLQVFVDDSLEQALSTLLSAKGADLTDADIERLQAMLEAAKTHKESK
jgi:BlaI family penicillinase repressor